MAVRVVLVTDGKRGHENQSRVVAGICGDNSPLAMQLRDSVSEGGAAEWMLRLRLRLFGPSSLNTAAAARLVQRYLVPQDNQAFRDFATAVQRGEFNQVVVVSTGTPPATFNLVLTAMLGATSVVVMTPSLLPRSSFGLNIVPGHDWGGGTPPTNVIVASLALGHFDETAAEHLAGQIVRDHSLSREGKYWGLALGGPSKSAEWDRDHLLSQLDALFRDCTAAGAKLLVTTSRRTPAWCLEWLTEQIAGGAPVAYLLDAASDPLNPLPAFYVLARRMLVTADSFSMVSEAANAGFKPELIDTSPALGKGKLGRSLSHLLEQGLVTTYAPGQSAAAEDTRPWPANWHYNELREAVRLKLGL